MINSKQQKLNRINSGLPDAILSQTYNLIIGACLLYGFVVNALIVGTCSEFFMGINPWTLIIGYVISCIVGALLTRSDSALVSFIGYNLVVVPIGAVMSVSLPGYPVQDILSAIVVTGVVVLVMMILSTLRPNIFAKMGKTLFIGLLVSLVAEIIAMLFGYAGTIFNWIFVIIFSLYIGYDWHKAQMYPKTVNNAVDAALDIYLDIINLFLRLLEIFGVKDND